MIEQFIRIGEFVLDAFMQLWPYLLLTIPLAVAIQLSGASKYINRAFSGRPVIAILTATLVGAFSPFCSCGVIPVITVLLISGVPLAPVMSFWIASPLMDPEIFFLSVATIGWELAVWRLAGALVLSLAAGFITHAAVSRGWLGERRDYLRQGRQTGRNRTRTPIELVKNTWLSLKHHITNALAILVRRPVLAEAACCATASAAVTQPVSPAASAPSSATAADDEDSACGCGSGKNAFYRRLLKETWKATIMVIKFMVLAFVLEASIMLFVPKEWIIGLLGSQNSWAVLMAAVLGVPVYTSNLTALPMISGLLAQGMSPAAGLAFLIAGPTTTLPAMAAVFGLVTRRVFLLYVSFSLLGAVIIGYIYQFVLSL